MGKERTYLVVLASTCLATMAIAALINIIVDPYAMHGVVDIDKINRVKEESGTHARLYTAAMISRQRPTVIALGTSRSARGISMDHPGWSGAPTERYNASLLGANMYEIERYFEHANRTHRLTQVVVGLDLFAFNVYKPNQADFNEGLVLDQQRDAALRHRIEILKTSLSRDTVYSSWLTLRCNRRECDTPFLHDGRENPDLLERSVRDGGGQRNAFLASAEVGLTRLYFPPPEGRFALEADTRESQFEALARMIEIARREHIDLRLFISPTHALQCEVLRAAGLWRDFERWKRTLVALLEEDAQRHPGAPPIPLWDFSGYNTITTEEVPPHGDRTSRMRWYWESSHYRKELGDLVLDRVLGYDSPERKLPIDFGVPLTSANLVRHVNGIRLDQLAYRRSHDDDVAEIELLAGRFHSKDPHAVFAQEH